MEQGEILIKITTAPSFEGERVLMLVRSRADENNSKHYIIDDRTKYTGYMVRGPRVHKAEIPEATFREIVNELEKTQIGIQPDETWGLDGTMTTIEIERGLNILHLSWWGGCPDSWRNLDRAMDLIQHHFYKNIKEDALLEPEDDEL